MRQQSPPPSGKIHLKQSLKRTDKGTFHVYVLIFCLSAFLAYVARSSANENPQLKLKLGHSVVVSQLQFDSSQTELMSTDISNVSIVWDLNQLTEIGRLRTAMGFHPCLLPDGRVIAREEEGLYQYDFRQKKTELLLRSPVADWMDILSVSPNGTWLVMQDKHSIFVMNLHDLKNKLVLLNVKPDDDSSYRAVFDRTSKSIGLANDNGNVWTFRLDSPRRPVLRNFKNFDIASMAFSGGNLLVVGDLNVEVSEHGGNRQSKTKPKSQMEAVTVVIDVGTGRELLRAPDEIFNPQISPDGKRLYFTDVDLRYTPIDSWNPAELLPLQNPRPAAYFPPTAYSVSQSGAVIATANASLVKIYDAHVGKLTELSGPIYSVEHLNWAPNFYGFYTTAPGQIAFWDLANGFESGKMSVIGDALAFSANGKFLAYFSGKELQVVDRTTGTPRTINIRPAGLLRQKIALSADGSKVFWNDKMLLATDALYTADLSEEKPHPTKLCDLAASPWHFSVSFSGKSLLANCASLSDDSESQSGLVLWNTEDLSRKIVYAQLSGIMASAFSIDERRVALATRKQIHIIDLDAGDTRTLEGSANQFGHYTSLAFNADGTRLVAGLSSSFVEPGYVELWDLIQNTRKQLKGHAAGVTDVMMSGDGTIYSCSEDGSVIMYDKLDGRVLLRLIDVADHGWLVVADDGLFEGSTDAMKYAAWKTSQTATPVPIDAFFDDFYYPGLLAEESFGERPRAETQFPLAAKLQIPGLSYMLSQRLASVQLVDQRPFLCLPQKPTEDALDGFEVTAKGEPQNISTEGFESLAKPSCAYGYRLPGGIRDYEIASRAKATDSINKWDGTKSTLGDATVHIQSITERNYSLANLSALTYSDDDADAIEESLSKSVTANAQSNRPSLKIWKRLRDASLSDIRARLVELASQTKPDDILVLFFSGHGVVPPGDRMFYFLAGDVRGLGREDVQEAGLSAAMLAEFVRLAQPRRMIIILDACQSGGGFDSLSKVVDAKLTISKRLERIAGTSYVKPAIFIIAASTPFQLAAESSRIRHGALTKAILDGLQTAATTQELANFVPRRLEEITKNSKYRQTATILYAGTDIPLKP